MFTNPVHLDGKPASRTRDYGRLTPCRFSMSAKSPRHSWSFVQSNTAALLPRQGLTGSWISIGDNRPSHSLRSEQRAMWRSEWSIGSMSDRTCHQTVFAGIGGESFFRQDLEICKRFARAFWHFWLIAISIWTRTLSTSVQHV